MNVNIIYWTRVSDSCFGIVNGMKEMLSRIEYIKKETINTCDNGDVLNDIIKAIDIELEYANKNIELWKKKYKMANEIVSLINKGKEDEATSLAKMYNA